MSIISSSLIYITASNALSASYMSGLIESASYVASAVSSSYAKTASYALPSVYTSSLYGTASWANNTISSSYSTTSSYVKLPITESGGAIYYGLERMTMGSVRRDPTGFENRTSSTLTYDLANWKFIISGSNFRVYSAGKEYLKNNEALVFGPVAAGTLTRFYYAENTLALSSTTAVWDIESANVPIATLYYDGKLFVEGDERHGIQMDGKTQEYLHETSGPRYAFGYAVTHTGSNPNFIVGAGEFYDDDNEFNDLSPISQSRVIWHSGSVMVSTPLQARMWVTASGGSNVAYDNLTTTASVGNTQRVAYWLYAVNGTQTRFISVMGQRVDINLANARTNNLPANLSFGSFPLDEAKLLYRFIYTGLGALEDTTDYRQAQYGGSTYTAADHGSLSGLTDDDHPQYVINTGARGSQQILDNIAITGSLSGTASYALTSSYFNTSSATPYSGTLTLTGYFIPIFISGSTKYIPLYS